MNGWDLSDNYLDIPEYLLPNTWDDCPICLVKPKVWLFDNGRLCACKCYAFYGEKVSAIAIMPYYREHNTLAGFPDNELRDNWNKRCFNLARVVKIKKLLQE